MKFLSHYKGLRKEMYVLFYGRIVTNMGAVIGSMMTLILSNKLGMTAGQIATLLLVMGLIELPCTILGGKLADKYNKKNIIIICDLVTVTCFIVCAFLPVSYLLIVFYYIAALFAKFEWPAYDALVADFTLPKDRERAYSLSYLGGNLGLVLSPAIGGFLFENYLWLAFLINAFSTLSSTVLIFFLVKNITREEDKSETATGYETFDDKISLKKVLSSRKIIFFFIACSCISSLVYAQFNYLIPLNLGNLYGADGAKYFGLLTSVNATVVIVFTPLFTAWFAKVKGVLKAAIGEALITLGLAAYIFIQGIIPMYFVAMVIFTFGEIMMTLGKQPYLTRRVPASHRGRIAGISMITATVFETFGQKGVGELVDRIDFVSVWWIIAAIGLLGVGMYLILYRKDKKRFPLLYMSDKELLDEEIT